MKKLILFVLFLVSVSVRSQTDSSALDKMTPEELMEYYNNEKPPISNFKGPEGVGDTLYNELSPQVVPTETVHAYSLFRWSDDRNAGRVKLFDSLDNAEQKLKPKVALGAGRLAYYGDLYAKGDRLQSSLTARMAYDLNISQRLTRYLQLNFNVMFGKLGANENLDNRHENFESEIRAGGLNLLYDFGNFISDEFKLRPFVSFGITGFEFLSKTDLKDKYGNTYHYWSDGSIKNMPEGAPGAQFAVDLQRDYIYETDVRERNADGFGKYREAAIAFPVGAGVIMKISDRVDVKMNYQMFFSTTDYIDGVSNKSVGNRIGTKQKDNFGYLSFSLQYDLIAKPRPRNKMVKDTLDDKGWLALDNEDRDGDGVIDLKDECQGTPEGVKVDAKGCPLDDDNDGIPNYRDDELATASGVPVDEKGVGQTDEFWKAWYDNFMNDSTGADKKIEYVGGPGSLDQKMATLGNAKKDMFTIELARYHGAIPSDELALLLSIGDIKSITLDDGTTVVYTAGEYRKIKTAVKRRDEFRAEGNKGAMVSRLKGKNIEQISEEELAKLLKKAEEDELLKSGNLNNGGRDSSVVNNNNPNDPTNPNNTNNTNNNNTNNTNNTNTNNANNTNTATATANTGSASATSEEGFNKSDIVYRVQLGAFNKRISTSVFNTSAGVLELKMGESSYKYVTRGYKTIEEAAAVRADLVIQGYSDAFVTAYKDGKRIPMNQTKATVDKSYKEDLNEAKMFSSVDKKLVQFHVQLGTFVNPAQEKIEDEKYKSMGINNIEKQSTSTGKLRYIVGNFNNYSDAEKMAKQLSDKGVAAFTIATFKSELISNQEALELLKK